MRNLKKVLSITAAAAMAVSTVTPVSVFAESEETFKIGVIGPMTGDYAQYGNGVYNAARIAADEIYAFLLENEMEIYLVVFDGKATHLGEKIYQI